MQRNNNFIKLFIIVTLIIASVTFSQGKSMHMNMNSIKTEKQSADSNIVRNGVIKLKSIDKNIDEKVQQCPIDTNILDDEKVQCPLCGMNIKEVTWKKLKKS